MHVRSSVWSEIASREKLSFAVAKPNSMHMDALSADTISVLHAEITSKDGHINAFSAGLDLTVSKLDSVVDIMQRVIYGLQTFQEVSSLQS